MLALVLSTTGCGRKPTGLLPPDDAMADAYPQVYPKPLPSEGPQQPNNSNLENKYKARPETSLQ